MAFRNRMPHIRLGYALGQHNIEHQGQPRFEKRQLSIPVPGGPDDESSATSATNTRNNVPLPTASPATSTSSSSAADTSDSADDTTSSTTEVAETSRTTRSTAADASTSTTESPPTTETTSTTHSSSTVQTLVTSSSTRGGSTSYVTNIVTVPNSATLSSATSSSTSTSSSDNGPSTGAVVGIVAGGLVGIVVVAGLLGYFFKAKFGKDDDAIDDDVFNKNDFRRTSAMLLDNDDDERMSMRSGSAAGTLNRNAAGYAAHGALLPGLNRANTAAPRPPSLIERHYMNTNPGFSPHSQNFPAHPMPSFQPGQIVSPTFYGHNAAPVQPQYNPEDSNYSMPYSHPQANQQPQYYNDGGRLDRNGTVASHYATVEQTRAPTSHSQYADLNRQASSASEYAYGQQQDVNSTYPPGRQDYMYDQEVENMHTGQQPAYYPARSGTPTDPNQQQFFTHKQARDSTDSNVKLSDRAQRTLSIRNAGNQYDDAYSGI